MQASSFGVNTTYNLKASNLLQAGLTAEKDAGEQFWGKHNL